VPKAEDWVAFAREQALRAHGIRTFSTPPNGLQVDAACPDCGRADRWVRTQVLGESPGRTAVHASPGPDSICDCGRMPAEHAPDEWGRIFAVPAQRSGVKMYCYHCGAQYTYRDMPLTEREQALRTGRLVEQAKLGRIA
jgi:predicted RNA-binding Zn-ribbon protein involved in translation (DUF1610 family)